MFFQYELRFIVVSKKKRIHYSREDGIRKSVPRDHGMSLLSEPRDANR